MVDWFLLRKGHIPTKWFQIIPKASYRKTRISYDDFLKIFRRLKRKVLDDADKAVSRADPSEITCTN